MKTRSSSIDIERASDSLFKSVQGFILRTLEPIVERIRAVEAREPLKGDPGVSIKGDPGDNGRSVTDALQDADGCLVLTFSDGATKSVGRVRGEDGADAKTDALLDRIAALESRLEAAEKAPDADNTAGLLETLERGIIKEFDVQIAAAQAMNEERFAELERNASPAVKPLDIDVAEIARGATASAVEFMQQHFKDNPPKDGDSIKGDQGRGIKDALIDADGNLVVSFTDGELKTVGRVKGEPGETPVVEDGKDGLGFEDMIEVIENDGRSILRRYIRGDQVKEFRHTTGWMIYRGVFKEGQTYERGDVVTWAGSLWHCNVETADKPGGGSGNWTLAAKKGRDGQDGVLKPPKPDGPLKI